MAHRYGPLPHLPWCHFSALTSGEGAQELHMFHLQDCKQYKECSSMGSCCHCEISLTAEWLATMVAWLTVVVEANCIRQPVFFVVSSIRNIRKRGGNNKKTTPLVLLY